MLVHEKEITRSLAFIKERLGTATGLGYPTTAELQHMLVKATGNEGNVMASLTKKNRMDCEMMKDIIAAAEVCRVALPSRVPRAPRPGSLRTRATRALPRQHDRPPRASLPSRHACATPVEEMLTLLSVTIRYGRWRRC